MRKDFLFRFLGIGMSMLILFASCDNVDSLTLKGNEALEAGDDVKAAEYYKKAVEKEGAEAARKLGILYREGSGVDKSPSDAVKLFSQSMEWGDSIAPYLLGQCYESSIGVANNDSIAVSLYEKSADLGYPTAYDDLCEIYFRGMPTVEADWIKAYKYADLAAANGDSVALAIKGFFVANGIYGGPQDKTLGEKLMRESIEKGSPLGKALLGYCILHLEDGRRNKEALALIEEAKNADEPFGIAFTGYAHECGYLRASFATASKYYQEASDKGCLWAMHRNGMLLIDLVLKSKEGHEWIRKAAERGDGDALSRLGYSYLNGYGEEKSSDKAFKAFLRGSEKGNANAMSNLAWCYENGEGVDADTVKAIEWYEKAIKYGDNWFSEKRLKNLK